MPLTTIEVHFPLQRIQGECYKEDELLLNCLGKINDTPGEDGLPLRQWVLRETHTALVRDPRCRNVLPRPRTVRDNPIRFHVFLDE
uniref:Uncharacterized protein n=1 Tax=Trypanosoma vivax (strain Y486) TaxID=1055687 RepID=G0U3V0_TRYVY|nr:conserved hypothetical protein [Trypanosoma vivax Y486]